MNEVSSLVNLDSLAPHKRNTAKIAYQIGENKLPRIIAYELGRQDESRRTRYQSGIQDLLDNDGNAAFLKTFRRDWGTNADKLQNSLRHHRENLTNQVLSKAPTYSELDSMRIMFQAGENIAKLPQQGISRLLEVVGYKEEESPIIAQKITLSIVLTGIEFSVFRGGTSLAMGYAALQPFLGSSLDSDTVRVLELAFAAKCAAIAINSIQTARLLRHPKIGNSPSVFSTGPFYLLDKVLPNKENRISAPVLAPTPSPKEGFFSSRFSNLAQNLVTKREFIRDSIASFVPAVPSFMEDFGTLGLVLIGLLSPSILAARFLADTGLCAAEAIAKEGWILSQSRQPAISLQPDNSKT